MDDSTKFYALVSAAVAAFGWWSGVRPSSLLGWFRASEPVPPGMAVLDDIVDIEKQVADLTARLVQLKRQALLQSERLREAAK